MPRLPSNTPLYETRYQLHNIVQVSNINFDSHIIIINGTLKQTAESFKQLDKDSKK